MEKTVTKKELIDFLYATDCIDSFTNDWRTNALYYQLSLLPQVEVSKLLDAAEKYDWSMDVDGEKVSYNPTVRQALSRGYCDCIYDWIYERNANMIKKIVPEFCRKFDVLYHHFKNDESLENFFDDWKIDFQK